MCLTFARVHLLEEAIHSFLVQDYPGEKELVVLNDFSPQILRFDHPEVTVINLPVRFRTLGEKRNAAAALARHDLLAVWDDDDIYLPHRLRFSADTYDPEKRFFKPIHGFQLNNDVVSGPMRHVFHSGAMWHRSLFDEVGGYAHMGRGQDKEIERRFKKVVGPGMNYEEIKPAEIYYLYRWRGTHSYHNSGFAPGAEGSEAVLRYAYEHLDDGTIPAGEVELHPAWRLDYAALVTDHLAAAEPGTGTGA